MIKITLYFLFLLLFTWLGLFIGKDSGYILISYGNTTIETTLWIGIIATLLVFLILYFITRLDLGLHKLPTTIKRRIFNRKSIKARALLKKGILAEIAGEWKKADKALSQTLKAKNSDLELINYLACAHLAHKQSNHEKCDAYLSAATITDKKAIIEIELLRAQFQIQNEQWQEAIVTLNQIRKLKPKHKMLLSLLQTTYLHLKDWKNLQLLLPLLRRYDILSATDLIQLEKKIYKELLLEHIENNNPNKIIKLWHKMPRSTHQDAEMLTIYITFLQEHSLHKKAEKILFKILPKIYHQYMDLTKHNLTSESCSSMAQIEKLIEQYSSFASSKPLKQLKIAEKLLQNHKHDATLLLGLARICKQQKLWGKAKNYLEQSLQLSPTAATYYELGQIMEMQCDKDMALNYYRRGLRFTNQ